MPKPARKPRKASNAATTQPLMSAPQSNGSVTPHPTASEPHPVAARLRLLADQIEANGIDSWVIVTVQPDGAYAAETSLGMHELTAVGFLSAFFAKVSIACGLRLFGTTQVPAQTGQIKR